MRVLKFGGTSVAAWERIIPIVAAEARRAHDGGEHVVVVVSALSGVTDLLVRLADAGGEEAETLDALRARHQVAARLGSARRTAWLTEVGAGLARLEVLAALRRQRRAGCDSQRHAILAQGERLAAPLVAHGLAEAGIDAEVVDGIEVIATLDDSREPVLDVGETRRIARARLLSPGAAVRVVTGFIGRGPRGATVTLGRGASDYSATVLGAALDASEVELWSDVEGVFTADPRRDGGAALIPHLGYDAAAAMARAGAKVIHPRCLEPLRERGIPVLLRSTFRPGVVGTRIDADGPEVWSAGVPSAFEEAG